jgi:5-oxoprolinase (ATP-hydrolysing) subunit A
VSGRTSIDLNADVGEGSGHDEDLIPLVSSVNVSCGAHAGDAGTISRALELARRHGAAIGAHPGFADREHFGRWERAVSPAEAAALVLEQALHLESVAAGLGARVGHVKLHGALYNMAARDPALAAAVVEALAARNRAAAHPWSLVALAGSVMVTLGRSAGLRVLGEAFADRGYAPDGALVPRTERGALLAEEEAAVGQALRIAREGTVVSVDGTVVPVDAETICLHGDGPGVVGLARRLRARLEAAGIAVRC